MKTAEILRIAIGIMGAFLLGADFLALAKRKMKESIGMVWCVFGVLLILLAAVPGLAGWSTWIIPQAAAAFILIVAALLWWLFLLSSHVSVLIMKNQELAMQVSLLNQENERILSRLEELTGKKKIDL